MIHAYQNNLKYKDVSRFVPTTEEFERAEMYRQADVVEKNIQSWSKWDLKRAYEDIKECVKLLENEVNGPAFDILKRIELNLKVFDSEKKA